ncbi:MAG: L,D-transpeptidase [Beijerinckiaceae bacterium]
MKRFVLAFLALFSLCAIHATAAQARVQIHIDLSSQRMTVNSSSGSYVWPVSTARSGYVTPRGSYAPYSLQRMHYSRKYHMSPMPHSIFFRGGYAIHGTYAVGALGRPASHGCIRLAPGNAAALFQMVQREGASISISGSPPGRYYAAGGKKKQHFAKRSHGKKTYVASRRGQAPMAYAPTSRGSGGAKAWQRDPTRY